MPWAAGNGIFGAPATTPVTGGGLFGAPAATPATGGGLFGAPAATPATGGGLFGAPAAPAVGGGGLFGAPAPAAGGGMFGAPAGQQAPSQALRVNLTTRDNRPATYQTHFGELSEESKQTLLQLESKVLNVRDSSSVLNKSERLTHEALSERQKQAEASTASATAALATLRHQLEADAGDASTIAGTVIAAQRATDAVLRTLTRAQQRRDGIRAAASAAAGGGVGGVPPEGYSERAVAGDWLVEEVARLEGVTSRCAFALERVESEVGAAAAAANRNTNSTAASKDVPSFASALRQSSEMLVHVAATVEGARRAVSALRASDAAHASAYAATERAEQLAEEAARRAAAAPPVPPATTPGYAPAPASVANATPTSAAPAVSVPAPSTATPSLAPATTQPNFFTTPAPAPAPASAGLLGGAAPALLSIPSLDFNSQTSASTPARKKGSRRK